MAFQSLAIFAVHGAGLRPVWTVSALILDRQANWICPAPQSERNNFDLRDLVDVELELSVPEMDIALFSALWPEWAAPATRRWVGTNIPAGRVKAAKLSIAADFNTPDHVRKIHQVSGDLHLQSADLIWQTGAPPLTAVDADLTWDNDIFVASIQTGRFDDLTLQRGRIVIEPVLEKVDKNAVISVAASGGVNSALKLAAMRATASLGVLILASLEATGDIEFMLEASIPINDKAPQSRRISKLDATITKGSFNNLPRGISMSDAELVIGIGTGCQSGYWHREPIWRAGIIHHAN